MCAPQAKICQPFFAILYILSQLGEYYAFPSLFYHLSIIFSPTCYLAIFLPPPDKQKNIHPWGKQVDIFFFMKNKHLWEKNGKLKKIITFFLSNTKNYFSPNRPVLFRDLLYASAKNESFFSCSLRRRKQKWTITFSFGLAEQCYCWTFTFRCGLAQHCYWLNNHV